MKTAQSPNDSTPTPAVSPPRVHPATAALCAAGLMTLGCASVPVRPPTGKQCPPEVWKAMGQREGRLFKVFLNPNAKGPDRVTVRPGPIISAAGFGGFQPKGSLFHGHVYFAEDGRVVIHYTALELEGGERMPICAAVFTGGNDLVFDVSTQYERTEESVRATNSQMAEPVRVFPD